MNYRPITDTWILARPKVAYYGAYPNGFLERARALLGITPYDSLLHVCGGRARDYPAQPRGFGPNDKTLDLDPALEPDYLQDARDPLPDVDGGWSSLIIDRPYTPEDSKQYLPGPTKFPAINPLLKEALRVVRVGGRVGIIDYVLPQPPREGARFVACISVIAGYNNRMRCYSVFEKDPSVKAKKSKKTEELADATE